MGHDISEYVAVALISDVFFDSEPVDFFEAISAEKEFAGDFDELKRFSERKCGFLPSDQTLNDALKSLADCKLVRFGDNKFSGVFVKIRANQLPEFLKKAEQEFADAKKFDDEQSIFTSETAYPNAYALINHSIFEDYFELGDKWLKKALIGIQNENSDFINDVDALSTEQKNIDVPASDRVVFLDDNQKSDFIEKTNEIVYELENQTNRAIDGDSKLFDRMIGQLKASKELFLSGYVRVELIRLALIEALNLLVEKYSDGVIASLAASLIFELAKVGFS